MNQELAEELHEYSLRKEGKYVQGVVMDIDESNRGGVMLTVETPTTTFTDTYNKPSPENTELEEVANEYGQGLVDIGALSGETVWCEEDRGQWSIAIRRGTRGKIHDYFTNINSDTIAKKIETFAFAPVYAMTISHQKHEASRWCHRRMPSDEKIDWSEGVFDMLGFCVFWLSVFFIGVLLL